MASDESQTRENVGEPKRRRTYRSRRRRTQAQRSHGTRLRLPSRIPSAPFLAGPAKCFARCLVSQALSDSSPRRLFTSCIPQAAHRSRVPRSSTVDQSSLSANVCFDELSLRPTAGGIRLDKDERRSLTSRGSTEYPFNIVELFGFRRAPARRARRCGRHVRGGAAASSTPCGSLGNDTLTRTLGSALPLLYSE